MEAVKYTVQTRKVREHPLATEGAENAGEGAFGSQPKNVFVLE